MAEQEYRVEGPIPMEPGDLLLLRTDGVDEAMSPSREVFGEERLLRLLSELRATGLEDSDLRLAFIAEIERIDLESSIIAHEGRHAIDARSSFSFMRRGAEKEFRAKLSEVAFSSAPFLALGGGILSKNIGDGSSHGDANERILKGVVEWMEEHGDTIDNLDSEIPLLPQLDRLTDEQLREAFRSMDPMAS